MSNNDWQKAIREAQNKKIEAVLAAQKEAEQERAEEQRELGKKLAKTLAFFGIEIVAPTRNLVTLGKYEFSLQEKTFHKGSGYDRYVAAYQYTEHVVPDNSSEAPTHVSFTLYVAPKGQHDADEMDWITNINQEKLTVKKHEISGSWDACRARLADKIDDLDFRIDLERKAYERRMAEVKQDTADNPDDPVGPAPLMWNGLDMLARQLQDSRASIAEDITASALLDIAYSLRRLVNQGDLNFAFGSAAGIDVDRLFDPLD